MSTSSTNSGARPPKPKQSALTQTANWIFRPLPFLEEAHQELGDIFSIRILGWANLVLISDPDLIRDIFSAPPELLPAGKANDLMGPVVGKKSVFLLDGAEHRQVRRILINSFNLEASRDAAEFSGQRASELANERVDGSFFDAHGFFSEIALATMLKAVLGISNRQRVLEYAKHFHLVLGGLSAYLAYLRFLQKDFGPGSPGWWIRTKMGAVHRLIERDLSRSSSGQTSASQIRERLESAGVANARASTLDQVVSLLVAGHDTVASALSWSLFWLLKTPSLIQDLRAELTSTSLVEEAPLLEAVCLEALRLIPTVEIVSRQAIKEMQIGNYLIQKGALVSPCVYLLHRNEALYPRSNEFDPTRFMKRQFAPHEYIPFGGGLRRCLGAHLGLLEMKHVLAAILLGFDFEPDGFDRVAAGRRNVTIAPSPRFRVRIRSRQV